MTHILRAIFVLVLALALPGVAAAQGYPTGQINWVIPYPPGGTTDAMARITAAKVSSILKVPVIPHNRSGASGTVGSDTVRQAAPDGYTVLFNASLFVLGKHLFKSLPYDPQTDFTPVARVGRAPLLVVTHPAVPAATISEFVTAARANSRSFNFGSSSLGSAGHLATLELMRLGGLDLTIVNYRGSAPALADLMSGQVQIMIDPIAVALPMVKGGKLKALAITTDRRSALAADIPTSAESGMPGLVLSSWYAVWVPKGVPDAVVARLASALEDVTKDAEFNERLGALGVEMVYDGPEAFRKFIAADVERNAALLKAANYQPE